MVCLFSFVLVRRTTRDNPVALVCLGFVNAMLVVFEATASSILLVSCSKVGQCLLKEYKDL